MRNSARKNARNHSTKSRLHTLERSYLQLLEAGKKEDAAKSLSTLSSAFDKSVKAGVVHRATANRLQSADGRFLSRALFPLGDPHAPEFYELWLAPHSREDAEAHRPGTRENLVVTAGTLELHIGRDVRTLHAGDAVVFTADVAHSYVNTGRDECWMYLVMSYPKV